MFEQSLVDSAVSHAPASRWPALTSVGIQCTVVLALLALPLLHPTTLALIPHTMSLVAPPPKLIPPPIQVHPQVMPTLASVANAAVTAPIERLNRAIMATHPAAALSDAPPVLQPALPFGSAEGSADALHNVMIGGDSSGARSVTAVPAGMGSRSAAAHPAQISTGVSVGLLLAPIRPIYPALALSARQSGTVVVAATISTTGKVEQAHAVSGPLMLQHAAVEAVQSARYRPYMLNGQPTTVEATFEINFRMN